MARQPVKPLDLAMLNREVPPPVARASELTISMAAIEASPAMCRALLASGEGDHLDGSPLSGTIVALIRRGLVEPGGDGRHLPLTDKGIRVRDRLRERAGGARG